MAFGFERVIQSKGPDRFIINLRSDLREVIAEVCTEVRSLLDDDATQGNPMLRRIFPVAHASDESVNVIPSSPCDWRTSRASHCLCWRCTGQEIEVLVARTLVAPCRAAGCYWCGCGRDDERLAPGIVKAARALAAKAGAQLQRSLW